RDARPDTQGYAAAAQAGAFLQASRRIALDAGQPAIDPVARAWIRYVVAEPQPTGDSDRGDHADPMPSTCPPPMAAVLEILSAAGVLAPPRALLGAGDAEADTTRLAFLAGFVAFHLAAPEELAFLTNAVLAGCAIHGRPCSIQEASDGVAATCNLGLENWPAGWRARDLVTAFQVGWSLLYRDVSVQAAR